MYYNVTIPSCVVCRMYSSHARASATCATCVTCHTLQAGNISSVSLVRAHAPQRQARRRCTSIARWEERTAPRHSRRDHPNTFTMSLIGPRQIGHGRPWRCNRSPQLRHTATWPQR